MSERTYPYFCCSVVEAQAQAQGQGHGVAEEEDPDGLGPGRRRRHGRARRRARRADAGRQRRAGHRRRPGGRRDDGDQHDTDAHGDGQPRPPLADERPHADRALNEVEGHDRHGEGDEHAHRKSSYPYSPVRAWSSQMKMGQCQM